MNLRHLEYLIELARRNSYTEAGRALYVTPQAIAKAVSEMQKAYDTELFFRIGKKIYPTEFGSWFIKRAEIVLQEAVDLEESARAFLGDSSGYGEIRLGISTIYPRGSLLSEHDLRAFLAEYPDIAVELSFFPGESCLSALFEGIINAAVILGSYKKASFSCIKLTSFRPCVALSKHHLLVSRENISLEDLSHARVSQPIDIRYVYKNLIELFDRGGILPPTFSIIDSSLKSHEDFMLAGGLILSMMNSQIITGLPNIKQIPLSKGISLRLPICLVYRTEDSSLSISRLQRYLLSFYGKRSRDAPQ